MTHQVTFSGGVLTVRLDGRSNTQDLYQELLNNLNQQSMPVTVFLDMTLMTRFDQQLKSLLFRALQHFRVARVGICGVSGEIQHDVDDLVAVLRRVRPVAISETEPDLRVEMGFADPIPQQHKLTGMLAHLRKN